MLSKPVRLALFVLGALAILGLTAGVTQAANQYLSGGGDAHFAAAQVGAVKARSLKAEASAALGASLRSSQAQANAGYLDKSEPVPVEKIEFSGVVTAIELGLWTIGNYQVQVTADTEVKGDPALGETVEVEAFLLENGTFAAHEIEIERVTVPVDDTHVDDKDDADHDQNDDQHDSGDDDADDDDHEDGGDDDHEDGDDGEEEECTEEGGGEHGSKP